MGKRGSVKFFSAVRLGVGATAVAVNVAIFRALDWGARDTTRWWDVLAMVVAVALMPVFAVGVVDVLVVLPWWLSHRWLRLRRTRSRRSAMKRARETALALSSLQRGYRSALVRR
jgi:hypothetical protein